MAYKKFILIALLLPNLAFAAFAVPWSADTTSSGFIYPNKVNGVYQGILTFSSSTLQNFTFSNATGTNATTTSLYVSGLASTTSLRANTALFGGRVGISTTTPWGMLSVTQTGTAGSPVFLAEDSASPDTSPFVITQTGAVAIGTSTPGTAKLWVSAAAMITTPNADANELVFEGDNNSGASLIGGDDSRSNLYFGFPSDTFHHGFQTYGPTVSGARASDVGFFVNSAEVLSFDSSGTIGIGTSSPMKMLEITDNTVTGGTLRLSSSDTSVAAGDSFGEFDFFSTDSSSNSRGVSGFLKNVSIDALGKSAFTFGTRPTGSSEAVEVMRINDSGYLGLGTTSPFAKFSLTGNASDAGPALFVVASTTSGTATSTRFGIFTNGLFTSRDVSANGLDMTPMVALAATTTTNSVASSSVLVANTWNKRTFAANTLTAGMQICVDGWGIYTTPVGVPSVVIRMVMGTGSATTTLAQVTTTALGSGATNLSFQLNGCVTVRSIGASGSLMANAKATYEQAIGTSVSNFLVGGPSVVDTTVAQTIDLTTTWDAASSDRSITTQQSSITIKN